MCQTFQTHALTLLFITECEHVRVMLRTFMSLFMSTTYSQFPVGYDSLLKRYDHVHKQGWGQFQLINCKLCFQIDSIFQFQFPLQFPFDMCAHEIIQLLVICLGLHHAIISFIDHTYTYIYVSYNKHNIIVDVIPPIQNLSIPIPPTWQLSIPFPVPILELQLNWSIPKGIDPSRVRSTACT